MFSPSTPVSRRLRRGLAALMLCAALMLLLSHAARTRPVAGDGRIAVVLDAGHGGIDGGAVGQSGTAEAGLNLAVTKLVQDHLEDAGIRVILTRSDENALGKNKQSDLARRREIMNGCSAAAVVSIHMNKFTDPSVHGPMTFYMKGSEEGQRLAESVIKAVCAATGNPARSANPGDYFVIRESEPPAVLVECGFLSNSAEEQLLLSPEYQEKLAEGIACGVKEYIG